MRAVWGWVSALAALWAVSSAAAAPVRVVLKPVDGGVEAAFHLERPAEKVDFTPSGEVVRRDAWRVLTDGTSLKAGVVTRADGKPIQDFKVMIAPDSAPRDRTYPGLTKVGEGWQVYGPYLQAKDLETRVDLVLPKGWTSAPGPVRNLDPEGYLYLGPKAYVATGGAVVITPPDVSPILRQAIVAAAERATSVYGAKLDLPLSFKPTIVVARAPLFNGGFQGDTTDGPAVSLRFFGPGWEAPNPDQMLRATRFVFHEFFHLWNSRTADSRDGNREAWLHEGMAEYAALITAAAEDPTQEAKVRQELGQHFANCARRQENSLRAAPPRNGSAVYDCGVLAQWAADLNARAGGKDVFAVWKAMFAPNAEGKREYDADRFEALAATPAADDPVKRLLDGPVDWDALAAALNARGAEIAKSRTPDNDRAALLWHLEREVCVSGSVGFYSEPDNLKLDTGDRCGPLNGDPHIDSVAGVNVVTEPSKAFDVVEPLCAAGKPVEFSRAGKLIATVTCAKPLKPNPSWVVNKRY